MITNSPLITHSHLLSTLLQANIHILRQIGRDHLPELFEIILVDFPGQRAPKSSIQHLGVEREEALGSLIGPGIMMVQGGDEARLVAVVVELEVDTALGEDGAFESGKHAFDGRVVGRRYKPVLENVAEAQVGAGDEGQEFAGPWVDVGCVDASTLR